MIFKIDKQAFVTGIKAVAGAIGEKNTISELNFVKAEVINNILYLTGFDLEMGIKTSVDVESDSDGAFLFDKKIVDLLVKLDNGDIEVKVEDTEITIKQGKSRNKRSINTNVSGYPALPTIESADVEFEISQEELKEMIDTTVFSASAVMNKPILTGELFSIENGSFDLVALDGYRLAIRNAEFNNDLSARFVVPAKALRELSKLITSETETVKIAKTSKHAIFTFNGITIFTRLLDGEFHNYKTIMPDAFKSVAIVNTREIINALERCMLIISDKAKAPVRCNFANGNVNISCETMLGKVKDDIEIDFSGDILEIGFNCKFLIEALKNCGSDKVKISLNAPTSPAIITALDGNKFTYVVLPVRLKY